MDNDDITFFLQLGVLLSVSLTFGTLAKKFKQPSIIGELLGGIILGPSVFKMAFPRTFAIVFPGKEVLSPEVDSFISFGMLLFMFCAGLEINIDLSGRGKKESLLSSFFGIIFPFSLGTAAAYFMPWVQGRGCCADRLTFALFFGNVMAVSALPVILKTLMDLKIMNTRIGTVIISAASIADLSGWIIFSTLSQTVKTNETAACAMIFSILKTAAFIISLIALSSTAFRALSSSRHPLFKGARTAIITAVILFTACLANRLGIHPFFAVFLLGATLKKYLKTEGPGLSSLQAAGEILASLYFVSIGLKVDLFSSFDGLLVTIVILIACLGKIIGASTGALISGMDIPSALCVGFGLNSRGAIEIIVATAAMNMKVFSSRVYVAIVVMSVLTSLVSGPAIKKLLQNNSVCPK